MLTRRRQARRLSTRQHRAIPGRGRINLHSPKMMKILMMKKKRIMMKKK
jgi:hypothetical protein